MVAYRLGFKSSILEIRQHRQSYITLGSASFISVLNSETVEVPPPNFDELYFMVLERCVQKLQHVQEAGKCSHQPHPAACEL